MEEKESEESSTTKEAPGAPEPESGPQDKAGVQNSEKQTTDDQVNQEILVFRAMKQSKHILI